MGYRYKKILVGGYSRTKPTQKYVKPYYRKQRFGHEALKKPYIPKQNKILTMQKKESDWSHQSLKYPNIIGLNDKQIEDFIAGYSEDEQAGVREYIKYIRAYNQEDIRMISKEIYEEWKTDMEKFNAKYPELYNDKNQYSDDRTIFITSPRGGLEVLSQFSYANFEDVRKRHMPYDLKPFVDYGHNVLSTDSLPYGNKIFDVNDIVFLDDVFVSGEQSGRALSELQEKLKNLNVDKAQYPRLHYMAIIGSDDYKGSYKKERWEKDNGTFRVGRDFSLKYKDGTLPRNKRASAFVFPFSIPDGSRHTLARNLYSFSKKFPHRVG